MFEVFANVVFHKHDVAMLDTSVSSVRNRYSHSVWTGMSKLCTQYTFESVGDKIGHVVAHSVWTAEIAADKSGVMYSAQHVSELLGTIALISVIRFRMLSAQVIALQTSCMSECTRKK
jgi:hypothetical protein